MNTRIKKDLYRYIGDDCESPLVQWRYVLFTPGFQYIYLFRRAQLATTILGNFFWSACLKLCSWKFGIQIPAQASIGEGFRISHFGTIVVNPDVKIGKNFTISQGCLIGNSQGKKAGVPTLGDYVQMGANSLIIGGVNVGNHVLVAPGAMVNFDVPDNCVVIGNPGKIIQRDDSPTCKYIVYSI